MKKSVKTENVVRVFDLIKNAKYSKVADGDKLVIFKVFKAIKKIANDYSEEVDDARKQFMPYEEFFSDLQKAQAYEIAKNKGDECRLMTYEEYQAFIQKFVQYDKLVKEAVRESSEKMVGLDFECISPEAFERLVLSNNWTFDQTDEIGCLLCE